MKRFKNFSLWFILILTAICLVIDLPKVPLKFNIGNFKVDTIIEGPDLNLEIAGTKIQREFNVKQGLDLKGGTQLVLETDMSNIEEADREDALLSVKDVIEKRVNLFGVSEPNIQTSQINGFYRVLIELPGVTNVEEAISLVGQTAQLDFRENNPEATENLTDIFSTTKSVGITGADLKKAQVQFDPQSGNPYVSLEFTDEGGKKFAETTSRLVGQTLMIFLDNNLVSAPTVNEAIEGGKAQITGDYTVDTAKALVIQLNAGALPVPIKGVIEQRNVGPTLGAESVTKSVTAGLIGLSLVMLFMAIYYGRLGLIADVALVIYGLITLAVYKIIPITLTMSGVAGFIISIGMAVDSNILIFERMKEEMRWGKPWQVALELGFGRAWDSIRDANICTIIAGLILFNPFDLQFLNTSGPIRGFALTLMIGIAISLFTGIFVTRVLLRTFYSQNRTN